MSRSARFGLRVLLLVFALCITACGAEPYTALTPRPDTPTPAPTAIPTATPIPPPAPHFESGVCPFTLSQNLTAGRNVECGFVVVPEEHAKPFGRTLRLATIILKNPNFLHSFDPIVYLHGGPADSVEGWITAFSSGSYPTSALLKDRDIILFDQRGSGRSEPSVACSYNGDNSILSSSSIEQQLAASQLALENCRDELQRRGVNLSVYNSVESAADVHDLRQALNMSKFDLYGVSYGTRLALTVMRDFPQDVRSVILDSTVPLQADVTADSSASYDRALKELFRNCDLDAACSVNYPHLQDTFEQLVVQLDAHPLTVPYSYASSGYTYDATLSGVSFVNLLFNMLYSSYNVPYLPALISDLQAGKTDLLTKLWYPSSSSAMTVATYYSVECGELVSFSSVAKLQAKSRDVLPQIRKDYADYQTAIFNVCHTWPAKKAAPIENKAVSSEIPTLILQGQYDPITPPNYGQMAESSLGQSQYLYFPASGHGVLTDYHASWCAAQIARGFYNDPTKRVDSTCIARVSLQFATPSEAARFASSSR